MWASVGAKSSDITLVREEVGRTDVVLSVVDSIEDGSWEVRSRHGLVGRYVGVLEDGWRVGAWDSIAGSISKTSFDGSERDAVKVLDELSDEIVRMSEVSRGAMVAGGRQTSKVRPITTLPIMRRRGVVDAFVRVSYLRSRSTSIIAQDPFCLSWS